MHDPASRAPVALRSLAAVCACLVWLPLHLPAAEANLADWDDFDSAVSGLYDAVAQPWMIYPAGPFDFVLPQLPQPFDPAGFPGLTNAVPPDTTLGVPCWRLRVMETQLSQRVWITFADEIPLRTNNVPAGYTPAGWVEAAYGQPPAWLTGEARDDWYLWRDRSRFVMSFALLTETGYTNYLAQLEARSGEIPLSTTPGPQMPADSNAVAFAGIECTSAAGLTLWIYSPEDALPVDLFGASELTLQTVWSLAGTLPTDRPFAAWHDHPAATTAFFTLARADLDSDGDGISDGRERLLFRSDPHAADSDGDGINDFLELYAYGTEVWLRDSDGDGIPDGWEIAHGLNPTLVDADADPDGDTLVNGREYRLGTDPFKPSQEVAPATMKLALTAPPTGGGKP